MKEESIRWIEAGEILALNPQAKVICPKNLDAELIITDVSLPGDSQTIERHMRCPKCGAYNALRLKKG